MSEATEVVFAPSFNRSVKIRSRDERLTSDAGVLLLREADDLLGLTASLCENLVDPRDPDKVRYTQHELLRSRIFGFAMGYSAADDSDRSAHDPAFRLAIWDRAGDRVLDERLASQPTQSRLLDALSGEENRAALNEALADWTERHLLATSGDRQVMRGTIDVDGLPIEVHGQQEGAAYNGYYKETVYSPYVASFAPHGDYDSVRLGDGFVGALLRGGTASPHEEALDFIRATYKRCAGMARSLDVRLDAGFIVGEVLDGLTSDGIRFVGRLRSNPVLNRLAEPYLKRPVGRPPLEGYESVIELGSYKAAPWEYAQRLVLCVVDKPDPKSGQLEMFPHFFFLVTSWKEHELSTVALLQHYRRRGTFEDRLGELNQTIRPRLSSPLFEENEATLLLALLAFNLVNILRGEMEANAPAGWDLQRLQTTVLKAGARVVTSARRLFVDVARSAIPLWCILWDRMKRWQLPERFSRPSPPRGRKWIDPPLHAHTTLVLRS